MQENPCEKLGKFRDLQVGGYRWSADVLRGASGSETQVLKRGRGAHYLKTYFCI